MEREPYADLTSIMGQKETKDASYTGGLDAHFFPSLDLCVAQSVNS